MKERSLRAVTLKAFPSVITGARNAPSRTRAPAPSSQHTSASQRSTSRVGQRNQGAAPDAPGQGRLGLTKRLPMRHQQVLDHRLAPVGLEQLQKADLQAGARRRQRMHRRAARHQQQPLHVRPASGGRTPHRLAAGSGSREAQQAGLGERADPARRSRR
jgi:hypothetical protein